MKKLSMDELNRLSAEQFRLVPKLPVIVVLDNVRSCHNIGSVFRTCDALLVEKLILCGITATPPNKEIHKSALDAEKSVLWEYNESAEQAAILLKNQGYRVYAIEQVTNSILLPDFMPAPDEKVALVFGNEVHGVQQRVIDVCDAAIEIPQFGTKHSFNISVSAGIVLWEVTRKINQSVSYTG
jgi:23S rRNA (guanosine2251-2'-O)-methyltransferase